MGCRPGGACGRHRSAVSAALYPWSQGASSVQRGPVDWSSHELSHELTHELSSLGVSLPGSRDEVGRREYGPKG